MPRGAKGAKPGTSKGEAELAAVRKSLKDETAGRRQLEKRLGDAQAQHTAAAEALKARDRELAEAHAQQAATSQILRVIASSPTDVRPVFAAVAASAARLCEAFDAAIFRVDGEALRLVAHEGSIPAHPVGQGPPLVRGTPPGRAVLDRQTVHVPDMQSEIDEYPEGSAIARRFGHRTTLVVPLLRAGQALGAIAIRRTEVRPFTDRQVQLLQTFAAQAVIAIENARLFTELQEKNRAVTEAHAQVTETLDQQNATSEILRVISSSLTDVQPVFETIASSAARLFSGLFVAVLRHEGGLVHLAAQRNFSEEGREAAARAFPLSPTRQNPSGWVILERLPLNVPDIVERADFQPVLQRALGYRSLMAVPMLREDKSIGAIAVTRGEVKPFSEREVALLQTFADQAVIAIENVRLFQELEARNRELSEALEQQTATAEILRVIASSPTELQPVMDTVAENAARVCGADDAIIMRLEGDIFRTVAGVGPVPRLTPDETYPVRGTVAGRVVTERRTIHIHDMREESEAEFPFAKARQRVLGIRTILETPLLRQGVPIGVIALRRREVRPFSDKQVRLLETFADQAVIAIENVQLFQELEARNRDLTEALEQQTTTSEVLNVISRSTFELQPVLDTLIENATRLCAAESGAIYRFEGDALRVAADRATSPGFREYWRQNAIRPGPGTVTGRAALERRTVHIPDVLAEPGYEQLDAQRIVGFRTGLGVPMLKGDEVLGVLSMWRTRVEPFTDKQIALLQTFADQAVIAIENVRLFKELEARNRELIEALERQTATADILRVISSSPTDLQPVLDSVAASAARLSTADDGSIFLAEGNVLRLVTRQMVAHHGSIRAPGVGVFTIPITRGTVGGRAALNRQIVHVQDLQAANSDFPEGAEFARQLGQRAQLAVPLLREGVAIGVLQVRRAAPVAYTEAQIALLQTFADQAVIAIENVRLFKELEARNRDLTETLEQQTATAEILGVISSSPTDVRPVFEAIAANAARVCEAGNANVYRFDGSLIHLEASYGYSATELAALQGTFPIPPGRGNATSRAISTGVIVQVPDMTADPEYASAALIDVGFRTSLSVPMLREGKPIGTITVSRREVRPFSDRQIALLQTFAAQAVIAVENVRLFTELGARNRELTEALEQQTATADILRVISGSPTDAQPVFDTIARSAARLCEAHDAVVRRAHDGYLEVAALYGSIPTQRLPIHRTVPSGRAFLDRETVHILDLAAELGTLPEELAEIVAAAAEAGVRTVLAVPLLREGAAIGVIAIRRRVVRPFTDNQIALVKTFADQAVIAIENVRLFKELDARNRDLTESLEQQTATSQILRVIASSPTELAPVMETLAENAARVCGATDSSIFRLEGEHLRLVARHGALRRPLAIGDTVPASRGTVGGRAVRDRRTIQVENLMAAEAEFPETVSRARSAGAHTRTILATPLLREGAPLGVILINRGLEAHPFSPKQIALLETFANQAVIAIENVRLFKELEARNRELTETLEQQTATSEILRVIASSPTDLGPVMEAVAENAARVCGATDSSIFRVEGSHLRVVAVRGPLRRSLVIGDTVPVRHDVISGRAVLDRRTIHVEDILAAEAEFPMSVTRLRQAGALVRTGVATPLLREGTPLGVITIMRGPEVQPFSIKQITLLETFANQAVIAIDNVRLFNELRERTAELTRSVAQLTALGEVSRAVSSTLDVEAVLETIVSRAGQLAGADACTIYEYDEGSEQFHLRATHNLDPEIAESMRATPLRKGEGVTGRATALRQPVQVSDISETGAYQSSFRDALVAAGYRAALSVPLLREDQIIGSLALARKTPGEFSPEVVELLKTFATQSALAIQNARLFREIADKSRQLETASRHKSEFLASMSHELRTPLNAILGFNEMILGEVYGVLPPDLREPLTDIQNSGKHLLRLINNVLDLSKIEAGRMELAPTAYAVQDIVERVRASLHPLAAEKGLAFVASAPEDIPLAHGDSGRITQCLLNLAGNALKFTRHGRVEISVVLAGDRLVYRIADTGIGIAADKLETLFTEFRQGDATITSEFGGTGLGLSITKRFVEMHGGRIWVETEPGKGSTFFFEVPLRLAGGETAT